MKRAHGAAPGGPERPRLSSPRPPVVDAPADPPVPALPGAEAAPGRLRLRVSTGAAPALYQAMLAASRENDAMSALIAIVESPESFSSIMPEVKRREEWFKGRGYSEPKTRALKSVTTDIAQGIL
jgi:hypothetical protein